MFRCKNYSKSRIGNNVKINLVNKQRLGPFMIFNSHDEENHFVVCLLYFLEHNNLEEKTFFSLISREMLVIHKQGDLI